MHSPANLHQPLPVSAAAMVLPLASMSVQAGFPSPAEDECAQRLDLASRLIKHPQATHILGVSGNSMEGAGIFDRDLVLVDKALRARHMDIVVAVMDGEFTIKYFYNRNGSTRLKAANPTFPDIIPRDGQLIQVWGVVICCIKQFIK